jgi:hypothetical protein
MSTVTLSPTTYQWLQRKTEESTWTPDQVADELLLCESTWAKKAACA